MVDTASRTMFFELQRSAYLPKQAKLSAYDQLPGMTFLGDPLSCTNCEIFDTAKNAHKLVVSSN
jgi:hypothetical protein